MIDMNPVKICIHCGKEIDLNKDRNWVLRLDEGFLHKKCAKETVMK